MRASDKPHQHRASKHDSAIDLWIALMLLLAPAMAVVIGLYLLRDGRLADASNMFLAAAAILIISAAFTLPCRYTILDDALSIRCGLICYQVALQDIRTVEPTATLKSGPALSLRRVLVATDDREIILSPKDREKFIAELNDAVGSLAKK